MASPLNELRDALLTAEAAEAPGTNNRMMAESRARHLLLRAAASLDDSLRDEVDAGDPAATVVWGRSSLRSERWTEHEGIQDDEPVDLPVRNTTVLLALTECALPRRDRCALRPFPMLSPLPLTYVCCRCVPLPNLLDPVRRQLKITAKALCLLSLGGLMAVACWSFAGIVANFDSTAPFTPSLQHPTAAGAAGGDHGTQPHHHRKQRRRPDAPGGAKPGSKPGAAALRGSLWGAAEISAAPMAVTGSWAGGQQPATQLDTLPDAQPEGALGSNRSEGSQVGGWVRPALGRDSPKP